MRPAIEVEGLNELRRALRHVGDAGMKRALTEANRELAKQIVKRALPNVPVRTGALKRSVRGLGNQSGAIGKAGSAVVPYAAAVHWGRSTGNVAYRHGRYSRGQSPVKANPFLWRAGMEVERDVVNTYRRAIDELMDQIRSPIRVGRT